ncbi:MAG: ABC transporter ATP-binding protein [Clostridium sp.]|uniref:ABC transporter ATP-binding protein n=1 Tax=Clostridium sp. TaxID=1506 RepID=UPI003F34C253
MDIKIKNVYKTYGKKNNLVKALNGVDLEIKKGEMVAIIGKSGSGKSTLLNIIGLIDNMDSGEYILNEENVSGISEKALASMRNKSFGFIFQHFGLINDISVFKNIKIPLEYAKVPKKEIKERVLESLREVKLEEKVKEKPKNLSGGQCQRVAIARALINKPDVIIADEPTGALDKATGKEIMEIFKRVNKEGKTIIIVTHDLEVANCCSRIIEIEDGMIIK